jgi:hypothetical protein
MKTPQKNLTVILVAGIFALLLFSGCTKEREEKVAPNVEPKTSFGENVKRAKDLSSDSDERNDLMKSQAEEIEVE